MDREMTETQLTEIEARVARATEGPWAYEHCGEGLYCIGLTEPPVCGRIEDEYDEARRAYLDKPDVIEFVAESQRDNAGGDAAFIAHARTDVPALVAEVRRLTRERDALRAIIEGRTTPPTDEEIAAHEAASGRWRVRVRDLAGGWDNIVAEAARSIRDTVAAGHLRWWPLDRDGRPCAWPVPATTEGA